MISLKFNQHIKMQESKNDILVNINFVLCSSNNSAITVCTSSLCQQNPFLCVKQSCQCRKQKHMKCTKIPLAKIWNKIHMNVLPSPSNINPMVQAIEKSYDQLIEQLSKRKVQFVESIQLFSFQQYTKDFINKINEGTLDKITGKIINKVIKQLQSKIVQQFCTTTLQKCAEILKQSVRKIDEISVDLKDLICLKVIDSAYLTVDNEYELQRMLNRRILFSEKLYRARQSKFCSLKFHEKCDTISDTLTIVKTESGNIIGGYTPCKWQSKDFALQKEDKTRKSFLFSLSSNEKYSLQSCKSAITCYGKMGPIFGSSQSKICYGQHNGKIILGFNKLYSYQSGTYLEQQECIQKFCGAKQNEIFTVEDYQVFQLVFAESNN